PPGGKPAARGMGSRNRLLSADERRMAVCLYQSLLEARQRISRGEKRPAAVVRAAAATLPRPNGLKLEDLEIVDPHTMQPVDEINGPVRVAGAMWVGSTRLIDNLLVS